MIRRVTSDDLPFLMELAHEAYRKFDPETTLAYLAKLAASDAPFYFMRTENAACLADATAQFYTPTQLDVHMVLLAARRGTGIEGYLLLKDMLGWAREVGASEVHFGSSTGVDLTPFAKRLGAIQLEPSFKLELGRVEENLETGP